jgi:hypothetical protein
MWWLGLLDISITLFGALSYFISRSRLFCELCLHFWNLGSHAELWSPEISALLKVKVTLRLTASLLVSLGVEPQLGLMQIFITFWQLRFFFFTGALSLMRERVCLLYKLLALASVVFLGSEFFGIRDHTLLSRIWDFLFVSSYDSHGHGGGIQPQEVGRSVSLLRHSDCFAF